MSDKEWSHLSKSLGNLFVDLGKLVFGSLMLGSVIRSGLDPFQAFVFGADIAIVLFVAGCWFIARIKE